MLFFKPLERTSDFDGNMNLKNSMRRFLNIHCRDSMYHSLSPLRIVCRLLGSFYLEVNPKTCHCRVNLFQLWNIPGLCLTVYSFHSYFLECTQTFVICLLFFAQTLMILLVYVFTEATVKDFFNAVEDIDKALKSVDKSRINSVTTSVQLTGYIVLHVVFVALQLILDTRTLTTVPFLTVLYRVLFKKVTFLVVKIFCDEVGARFRRVERSWRRALLAREADRMEHARLLYHEVHAAAILLAAALGPRLLLMMVDLTLQNTRFFVATFLLKGASNGVYFFLAVITYDLYCLLTSMTAVENMIIKVRRVVQLLSSYSLADLLLVYKTFPLHLPGYGRTLALGAALESIY